MLIAFYLCYNDRASMHIIGSQIHTLPTPVVPDTLVDHTIVIVASDMALMLCIG